MQANVHGGEESGTESSLQLLYELADRNDCVSHTILDNTLVVIVPVQNPDGREADTRRNAYDIDMNRDWFARTQPETDARLELYRQLPPVLDLDVHEMGAFTYFFPPNSDPVYHEIADESNDWINGIYGPAMAAEFDRQRIRYFNYEPYDFFGIFYGDTVPTVAFHGGRHDVREAERRTRSRRMYEQYVTSIVSVFEAAIHKEEILQDWHASWVEAAPKVPQADWSPTRCSRRATGCSSRLRREPWSATTSCATTRQGLRGAAPGPPAAADGRGASSDSRRHLDRARLPRVRPAGGEHHASGRDLLDPLGAGARSTGSSRC